MFATIEGQLGPNFACTEISSTPDEILQIHGNPRNQPASAGVHPGDCPTSAAARFAGLRAFGQSFFFISPDLHCHVPLASRQCERAMDVRSQAAMPTDGRGTRAGPAPMFDAQPSPCPCSPIAAIRRSISSGVTSSMWVAMVQRWLNGSTSVAERSP
jgi:hypothetical protein